MSIKKSVVLFSGNGSNLKNLLENSSNIKDKLVYETNEFIMITLNEILNFMG